MQDEERQNGTDQAAKPDHRKGPRQGSPFAAIYEAAATLTPTQWMHVDGMKPHHVGVIRGGLSTRGLSKLEVYFAADGRCAGQLIIAHPIKAGPDHSDPAPTPRRRGRVQRRTKA